MPHATKVYYPRAISVWLLSIDGVYGAFTIHQYLDKLVSRVPALRSDLEKWEKMQRRYFDSRSLRREFLENMFLAIDQHECLLDDFGEEAEDIFYLLNSQCRSCKDRHYELSK